MHPAVFDERNRPEPPAIADEATTLLGFLDFLRATIEWKTAGLCDELLHSRPLPSRMSLGGLLKHLAFVEDFWFGRVLRGAEAASPWRSVDWRVTPDWDWESASGEDGKQLRARWRAAVETSRAHWHTLMQEADFSLERTASRPNGEKLSTRWVLSHMVEEYARHCGHADLLREALDGSTGE